MKNWYRSWVRSVEINQVMWLIKSMSYVFCYKKNETIYIVDLKYDLWLFEKNYGKHSWQDFKLSRAVIV
jgi:hypothetical protein